MSLPIPVRAIAFLLRGRQLAACPSRKVRENCRFREEQAAVRRN
jgi:hypothetical protein